MPLPLPPRSSKPKTKKSPSSKIVPSDHNQYEKRGENYQAKISPSSPQGALKKRSAFEDLTNALQSQHAQLKKEANREFIKNVFKKINRNTYVIELDENTEVTLKGYKLEPPPVIASTTLAPNIVEKPCTLEISTISKTPTTEGASLFKKPLILKEEPSTEETTSIKKSLILKKCIYHRKISQLEKPLTLLEETDTDIQCAIEPMTFRVKHKSEDITKRTLSLKKKLSTHQGNQSCRKEELALQDIDVEEDYFFLEPMNFSKKPKTEASNLTRKSLLLKKKYTAQGVVSCMRKPLVLQKTISEEKSLTTKPLSFKKKTTTEEESFFQEPSVLQEKRTTQGDMDILKKPWAFQGNINSEDNIVRELVSFKKYTTKESAPMKKPLPLREERCTTQGKMSHLKNPLVLKKTISGEKSLMKEPSSFKKKPTTGKESFFQEPSALSEKHTNQEEVFTSKKPLVLQKSPTEEESLFKEVLAFKKKRTIEEATLTNKALPLKKKHTTQGMMSCLKQPIVLQKTTSREKSLIKEPLFFEEEKVSLKNEKHTTQVIMSVWQELFNLPDMNGEDTNSFFMEPMSVRKNPTIEEAILTNTSLFLEKKKITQEEVSILKKPLVLQKTTSEEESLYKLLPFKKKSTTEEEFLFQEPSTLQEKHTTEQEASLSKESLALQESTTEGESYVKELLTLKEKPTTEEEFLLQELFSFHVKPTNKDESFFQNTLVLQEKTDTKEDSLKKLLALQEKSTIEEESIFKNLLVMKKEPSSEAAISTEKQLSLKKGPTVQEEVFLLKKQLALYENITSDEESLIKQPLALQKYPIIKKEGIFKEPFTMQEKPSIEEVVILKEPTTDPQAHFKEPLALQEKATIKKEILFKENFVLQKKSTLEEETLLKEPLALQEKPTIEEETTLKELMAMWEKLSIEKETFFKDALALQEKPTIEEEDTLKELMAVQEKPSIEKETFKEAMVLQEKPSIDKEAILRELLALEEKFNILKEALFKKPLVLQEKPAITEAFRLTEISALNEKPSADLSSKESLALDENPILKEDTFLKTFISQVETHPHVSITAPKSKTGKSSTTSKSSACESGSNKLFAPQGKRTPKEPMTPLLEDVDKDNSDPLFNAIYVKDIFSYMKEREEMFILTKYMKRQTEINSDMRAILVDWLVEIQTSFEMNHETLYLAVKLVDHYLMEVVCKKEKLQLLGCTAFLIAAKFEEIHPPSVDDFLYICADVYCRDEMHTMELSILEALKFDINIPVAYHFLRRYAACIRTSIKTVTLTRFICEMTLQEYDYIQERASKLAAGSFLLALYMQKLPCWIPTLEYYSGYKASELHPLVRQLNILLTVSSRARLNTVYSKYSHQVFFEVAKVPPVDIMKLEEMLNC
nr:G2/mitotic-specific cyclin-B3 isoform X1 [Microcebus murinus]XP_012612409.1 G2/mitotic-specific cyclin-B3 isoform X1 [Microcebus murinus]